MKVRFSLKSRLLQQKLKAVTILELVIVMTVTSLLVFIGYTGFRIVQQQFQHYKQMGEDLVDMERLNTLLKRDFFEAKEILSVENGIEVIYSQDGQQIGYYFDWEYIVRSSEASIDTFDYWTDSLQVFFMGSPQMSLQQPIDRLSLQIGDSLQRIYFHYQKEYAPDYLMRFEVRAERGQEIEDR